MVCPGVGSRVYSLLHIIPIGLDGLARILKIYSEIQT